MRLDLYKIAALFFACMHQNFSYTSSYAIDDEYALVPLTYEELCKNPPQGVELFPLLQNNAHPALARNPSMPSNIITFVPFVPPNTPVHAPPLPVDQNYYQSSQQLNNFLLLQSITFPENITYQKNNSSWRCIVAKCKFYKQSSTEYHTIADLYTHVNETHTYKMICAIRQNTYRRPKTRENQIAQIIINFCQLLETENPALKNKDAWRKIPFTCDHKKCILYQTPFYYPKIVTHMFTDHRRIPNASQLITQLLNKNCTLEGHHE